MRLTIVLAVLVFGAACGEDGNGAGQSDDDASSEIPPCAEVWVLGKKLPEDYIACDNGVEGYDSRSGYWHCSDGTEVWQDADSQYFASKGTRIRADDEGALHARLKACGALDGVP